MTTTVIRNADWVIAWDEVVGRHVYRRNIDIAFTDGTIVFVGPNYTGTADRVINGVDRLILPGLIDIHSHPEHEPLYRGVREEHGLRNMHMTGLYERSQAFSAPDDEARAASAEFAYCELLLSGVTSLVDISAPWHGWIEVCAKSGMRGFLAPGYASARWRLANDFDLQYAWDEAREIGFRPPADPRMGIEEKRVAENRVGAEDADLVCPLDWRLAMATDHFPHLTDALRDMHSKRQPALARRIVAVAQQIGSAGVDLHWRDDAGEPSALMPGGTVDQGQRRR